MVKTLYKNKNDTSYLICSDTNGVTFQRKETKTQQKAPRRRGKDQETGEVESEEVTEERK